MKRSYSDTKASSPYSPFSTSCSFVSKNAVIAALRTLGEAFRSTLRPSSVQWSFLPSEARYVLRFNSWMIAARVAGVPMPPASLSFAWSCGSSNERQILFHGGDERPLGEVGGRLRFVFLAFDCLYVNCLALCQRRERLIRRVVFAFLLGRIFFLVEKDLPAFFDNDFAFGNEFLFPDLKFYGRFVELVHGKELRNVAPCNETVELLLAIRELRPVDDVRDRDDAVVRRYRSCR